jgi:DNA-binding response OmpR family regulator
MSKKNRAEPPQEEMAETYITALLVEDNIGDARLLQESLRDTPTIYIRIVHAPTWSAASEQLRTRDFDVVLLDLNLPDSAGLETVSRACLLAPRLPIIILTGADDEKLAIEAVRLGAQDYLIKGQVDGRLLARAVHYAWVKTR